MSGENRIALDRLSSFLKDEDDADLIISGLEEAYVLIALQAARIVDTNQEIAIGISYENVMLRLYRLKQIFKGEN